MFHRISSRIKLLVISIHAALLSLLVFGHLSLLPKEKRKPLLINTIIPKQPLSNVQPASKKKATALTSQSKPKIEKRVLPPAPKPLPALTKKVPVPDNQVKKEIKTVVKKEAQSENRVMVSNELKKKLEESIAKIEKKKEPLSQPLPLIQLHIDSVGTESDYPDLIADYLRQLLHLPEFGEVNVQLTLHQDGRVAKLVVLYAGSERNKRYLEQSLPFLRFPSFNGSFAKKMEHTFTLTFCNEI